MASAKILVASAAVVVVASAALLAPSLAAGQSMVPVFAPASVTPGHPGGPGTHPGDRDGDGVPGNGNGKAWGHHKDSDDFPGNNGRGHGSDDAEDTGDDSAPGNGNGKAWGHHKDSDNFPGNNGRGHGSDD